jgi:hypothetical protein
MNTQPTVFKWINRKKLNENGNGYYCKEEILYICFLSTVQSQHSSLSGTDKTTQT